MLLLCVMQGVLASIAQHSRHYMLVTIFISIIGVCAVSLYGIYVLIVTAHTQYQALCYPTHVILSCNQIYTHELVHALQVKVQELTVAHITPDNLLNELRKDFPLIKDLTWHICGPQTAVLEAIGTLPCALINDSTVLAHDAHFYPLSNFSRFNTSILPMVYHAQHDVQKDTIAHDLYALIQTVPAEIFDQYTVHYKDHACITLQPKHSSAHYMVLCDLSSIQDKKKHTMMRQLITKTPSVVQVGPSRKTTLDIRFADRIIARADALPKGRRSYGKGYA